MNRESSNVRDTTCEREKKTDLFEKGMRLSTNHTFAYFSAVLPFLSGYQPYCLRAYELS